MAKSKTNTLGTTGAVKGKGDNVSNWVIAIICFFVILVCLLPMLNLLARSLSSYQAIINRQVSFWPVNFTWENYAYVFKDAAFTRSMWWTAFITIVCTVFSLAITVLCAYPLTYDWLKGRRAINTIIIFTMYFSAGTIPTYVWLNTLNLIDNPLVLILPNALSVFNMIILRSFFFGIPESLRESAELDGASPMRVLWRIYLPLSTSVLATLALFYAVGRWNGFSDALMYMSKPEYAPIQLKLYQIIRNLSSIEMQGEIAANIPNASDGVKAAGVMVATIPIVLVYPWLQRYFITGVTVGAVKG